ncbi:DUF2892 domain-containing protein [Jannaschia sp. W003]|uniref:YgaP family membrane protein n=1 Tax=Jannaschia sp. W003 TaxID=2867012 RepID=UPI0021A3EA0A|nr:DUF2892 domain-containing protein [Jannaschia sp. W003]UWQ22421.1 DUF2892 domain-containing protein [Jannaschia sp. W003]
MQINVGPADRVIRAVLGLMLVAAAAYGIEAATLGTVAVLALGGAGLILIVTAITGRCLLYRPFGISTD